MNLQGVPKTQLSVRVNSGKRIFLRQGTRQKSFTWVNHCNPSAVLKFMSYQGYSEQKLTTSVHLFHYSGIFTGNFVVTT